MKKRAGRTIRNIIITCGILVLLLVLFVRLFVIHPDPFGEGFGFDKKFKICVWREGLTYGPEFSTAQLRECEEKYKVAVTKDDAEIIKLCAQERETSFYWEQQCLFDFAVAKRDESLCRKIQDDLSLGKDPRLNDSSFYEDKRNECLGLVQNNK